MDIVFKIAILIIGMYFGWKLHEWGIAWYMSDYLEDSVDPRYIVHEDSYKRIVRIADPSDDGISIAFIKYKNHKPT